jgi:mRNA interferase MazF
MRITQFDIWLADMWPAKGTEPGKIRPVVIVQNDALNRVHSSTLVCPITAKVIPAGFPLRVHIPEGQLDQSSDIMVDQVRAIDNRRFIRQLGKLTPSQAKQLKENLKLVLDL